MMRAACRWTSAEDSRLEDLWSSGLQLGHIAQQLGRSKCACYDRAKVLGLPLGVPDGFERISHAAKRCGYHPRQLRRILRWARVPVKPALSNPSCGHKLRSFIVETFEVDCAIERWHATEPVESMRRRLNLPCSYATIMRRLAMQGLRPPGRRQHLRVTEDQVRGCL